MPALIRSTRTSSALEASQVASLLPGPYDFAAYRCRATAGSHQQMSDPCPIAGSHETGVCLAIEAIMDGIAIETGLEPSEVRLRNHGPALDQNALSTNIVKKHFDSGDYPRMYAQGR